MALLVAGAIAIYITKYYGKETQRDDQEEYSNVSETMQRLLSEDRLYDGDRQEAMRRLLRGSFAHCKNNVVHAPMASFLIRRDRRFLLSHETQWCYLPDLQSLLKNQDVGATVQSFGNRSYFVNHALHYICRPAALENVSVFDFFGNYLVVRNTASNREDNAGQIWHFARRR